MGQLLPHGNDEDVPPAGQREAPDEAENHHLETVEDHNQEAVGPEKTRTYRVPGMEACGVQQPLHGGSPDVMAHQGNQQRKTSPQGASPS